MFLYVQNRMQWFHIVITVHEFVNGLWFILNLLVNGVVEMYVNNVNSGKVFAR
jgi:hypothetical protein